MSRPGIHPPLRVFALLTLLIGSLHLLLLSSTPTSISPTAKAAAALSTAAFNTRLLMPERAPASVSAAKPATEPTEKPPAMAPLKAPVKASIKAPADPIPAAVTVKIPTPTAEPEAVDSGPEKALPTQLAALEQPAPTSAPTPQTPPASAPEAPLTAPSSGASAMAKPITNAALAVPAGPPSVVTAIALPGSIKLEYKMTGQSKGLNYFADAELTWLNSGNQYQANMKVSALFIGSRSMSSVGQINANGLAPSRFADKSRSELAAHFLPEQGLIKFSANTPDAVWLEGAQDRVSLFLQLAGMLAAGPQGKGGDYAPGANITLYTIGPRDADSWTFSVGAREQQNLPVGTMPTIRLTRLAKRSYDQKVEIWFAPELGFLPVRSKITQVSGDFVDQQLENVVRP